MIIYVMVEKCYGDIKENNFVEFKGNLWAFPEEMAFKLICDDRMKDMAQTVMSKRSRSTLLKKNCDCYLGTHRR